MSIEVHVARTLPRRLAAVRQTVALSEIPTIIRERLGEVWSFLGENKVASIGHNVCIYLPVEVASHDVILDTIFGVEVHEEIPASDRVFTIDTPAGSAAMATH